MKVLFVPLVLLMLEAFVLNRRQRREQRRKELWVGISEWGATGGTFLDCAYHYYLDGDSMIEVRNGSDQVLKQQVWGMKYVDELVQMSINSDPAADSTCETAYWVCQDANYNVLGIVDSAGTMKERYEYTPYGQRTVYFSPGVNDTDLMAPTLMSRRVPYTGGVNQPYGLCEFGHQGLYHDEELDLIYNRARALHPTLGRFMQRDSVGTAAFVGVMPRADRGFIRRSDGGQYGDGMNLYEYVQSNPVTGVDPTGFWREGPGGQARREYKSECNDTLVWVVQKTDLSIDINEVNKWLKGGTLQFADGTSASTGSLTFAHLSKVLKPDQKVTVPNVWVAGNLLQGSNLGQQIFVNPGGAIGIAVGTDMFTNGKKVVKATTFHQLAAASGGGDVWGIAIFGHGGKTGYLGDYDHVNWGYQSTIIQNLKNQGYRVAHAYAMQCYSHFIGTDDYGNPQNWKKEWNSVAVDAFGYQGINVLMFDTN